MPSERNSARGDVGHRRAVARRPQHLGLPGGQRAESPATSESAASAGSTTRRPACTRRTASASWAAGVSLTTKPLAPGLHRPAQVARAPERGHDQHPARRQRLRAAAAAAAMPSRPGISTSSSATSGRCSRRGRRPPRRRGRPRRPPRGRARGRAAPPARRAPAPGRRRAAAGSRRLTRAHARAAEKPRRPTRGAASTTVAPAPPARARAGRPARCRPASLAAGRRPSSRDLDAVAVQPHRAPAWRRCAGHVGDALADASRRTARAASVGTSSVELGRSASISAASQRHPRAGQLAGQASARGSPPRPGVRRPARRARAARGRRPRPGHAPGRPPSACLASSALTVITVSEWPRMSCRSRAKRLRSSETASRWFSFSAATSCVLRTRSCCTPHTATVAASMLSSRPGSGCQPATTKPAA